MVLFPALFYLSSMAQAFPVDWPAGVLCEVLPQKIAVC